MKIREHTADLRLGGRIILKWIFKIQNMSLWSDISGSE